MGENTEMTLRPPPAETMQEEIRHTESEISDTVHTIEERLSPANIRREAVRKSKQYALKGIAGILDLIRRRPVQVGIVGGAAVWIMLRKKRRAGTRQASASGLELAGTAAKAFVSGALGKKSKEASHSPRKLIWKGLATALGAAGGSLWYRRKPSHHLAEAGKGADQPRAGGYPGVDIPFAEEH